MKIGFEGALGVHPEALKLRAQRTEVLANNIANADTPNYKARDIDFRAVLAAQNERFGESGGRILSTTHSQHIGGGGSSAMTEDLLYRMPFLPSLDGNTVDGHVEQAEFASNTLHFMASLRFVDGRFKSMLGAIKGE